MSRLFEDRPVGDVPTCGLGKGYSTGGWALSTVAARLSSFPLAVGV